MTRRLNFPELFAKVEDAVRPIVARQQNIHDAYQNWFQREKSRPGATISGGAPDTVNEKAGRSRSRA